MNHVGPVLERGAVHHSYACRLGRGNHAALRHALACTRRSAWCLRLDVRRYFDHIDHEVLKRLLRGRLKDPEVLRTLDSVIDSFSTGKGRGIPIGTLTSQHFANFYLNGFDHWVLETRSCKGYVRYMDDMVLWHDDPAALHEAEEAARCWMYAERRLELKARSTPQRCTDGVPFLGHRITKSGLFPSRTLRRRVRVRLRENEEAHRQGALSDEALQRRTDSVLAIVHHARCHGWRRRTVSALPSSAEDAG
jgi:retron-type reverse transcriptase